jgi:hypothetical protein
MAKLAIRKEGIIKCKVEVVLLKYLIHVISLLRSLLEEVDGVLRTAYMQ